jgi:hypothetical protein
MRKYLIYLLMLFVLSSCESLIFEDEYEENDPFVTFDYMWEQADRHYSFFKVKNINWEEQRLKYRAQIRPGMSDLALFNVIGDLLRSLRDDHTNLRSSFNVAFYGVRYDGPDNYDQRIVEDHYIGRDYYVSGPFIHDWIANEQIGYIRLAAFNGAVNAVNLDFIFGRYRSAKGLIIDLRENGVGVINDMHALLGRLVDQRTVVYNSRIRNGKGHNDFSDLEAAVVEPAEGPRFTNRPVMFLVDRGSYSAASFTSLATKSLINVKLVGDTTGGGLGLPNGGYLPNGWFYRFSTTQTFTNQQAAMIRAGLEEEVNAENYENGVPPDFRVLLDRTDLTKDEVIDFAIRRILE